MTSQFRVLKIVLLVWLIVAGVSVAMTANWVGWQVPATDGLEAGSHARLDGVSALLISVASGLIALVAMLPGLIWSADPQLPDTVAVSRPVDRVADQAADEAKSDFVAAKNAATWGVCFLAGLMIRLAGTVALFLVSSYYMNASKTEIAAWVLAWHVVLLLAEVVSLTSFVHRSSSDADSSPKPLTPVATD